MKLIPCKDLKPKTDYWATYDYWGYGGKRVRLKKFIDAKQAFNGVRGKAAIVFTDDGQQLVIHPKASIFAEDPTITPPLPQVHRTEADTDAR